MIFAPVAGVLAILLAVCMVRNLLFKSKGSERMVDISNAVKAGAHAYIKRQFLVAGLFGIGITLALGIILGFAVAVAFSLGAVLSGLSAYIGMIVAINMNSRTASAALNSLNESIKVSTKSGNVVGLSLAGLGLMGVSLMYMIVGEPSLLLGMGFGASLIGLFARVGGGIYTKAADIGADLVGK